MGASGDAFDSVADLPPNSRVLEFLACRRWRWSQSGVSYDHNFRRFVTSSSENFPKEVLELLFCADFRLLSHVLDEAGFANLILYEFPFIVIGAAAEAAGPIRIGLHVSFDVWFLACCRW